MRAEDSDEDFEEVPEKEGFEPHILDDLREEYGTFTQEGFEPHALDDLREEYGTFTQVAGGRDLQSKVNRQLLQSNKGTCSREQGHTTGDETTKLDINWSVTNE